MWGASLVAHIITSILSTHNSAQPLQLQPTNVFPSSPGDTAQNASAAAGGLK